MTSTISPAFSVVIPLYNKEKYIRATLEAVKKQTFKSFEVIIVNDGSSDNSKHIALETIKNDNRFKFFSQENSGVSIARNKGIKIAKGKFIAFLDADDYWYPNHLSNIFKAHKKEESIKIICTNYKTENKKNKFTKSIFSYLPVKKSGIYIVDNYFRSSLKNSIAWTSAVCIEKNLLQTEDLYFDPLLVSNQDTDLWIRLGIKYSMIFINEVSAIHKCYSNHGLAKSKLIDNKYILIEKHESIEHQTPYLHAFLDQNRFSIMRQYIAIDSKEKALSLYKKINKKNLTLKRRLSMYLPWCIFTKI